MARNIQRLHDEGRGPKCVVLNELASSSGPNFVIVIVMLFSLNFVDQVTGRQEDFIARYINGLRKTNGKRKTGRIQFHFPHDGIPKRVCKQMFLKKLN